MRKFQSTSSAVIVVVLAMASQLAEAGPCSSDIADLETTLRQPGTEPPGGPGRQSLNIQLIHQSTPEFARRADEICSRDFRQLSTR
jgi:hypothetical protein